MNRFGSIFSQLLQLFPRTEFQHAVKKAKAERHARGFTCWGQFVAMLFCQLGRAHSLREICNGLASCEGKLTHLGIKAPRRSSLAYANEHRPWELYQLVFFDLLEKCRFQASGFKRKFRFRNKLMSIDSTTIDLCAKVFDWAKFRRTKGAVKLHLVLDHDGYLPGYAHITEGKVSDVKVAHMLRFDPGTIVVDDRGYNDFSLWGKWCSEGVFFVTRMKTNTLYEVCEKKECPDNPSVIRDEIIWLTGKGADEKCPYYLRRIVWFDKERNETFEFLTNHMRLAASTIAAIYKDRWQIEIFFKMLKQNLKIKTFVGTTANALKIQIWTALIAILILKYLQMKSTFQWSLSNLVALLRMNLFTYRDLWAWLNEPLGTPALGQIQEQLELRFA
jgi:hypothetical protein